MKRYIKSLAAFLIAGMTVTYSFSVYADDSQQETSSEGIRIIFTGDLNSQADAYETYDPENDHYAYEAGFARLAALIRQYDAENALTVDAGGFSTGSAYDVLYTENPVSLLLMREMEYDYVTLGAEDFRFGYDALAQYLTKAAGAVPVVESSIAFRNADDPLKTALGSSGPQIAERNGVRIGIFGIMGNSALKMLEDDSRFIFSDPREEARNAVSELDAQDADYVICLYHGGMEGEDSEAAALAESVKGIDLIISADNENPSDRPQLVNDTWIVSSGSQGRYLGVIDIDPSGNKLLMHQLVSSSSDTAEDPAAAEQIRHFRELRDSALKNAGTDLNTVIGYTDLNLGDPRKQEPMVQSGTETFAADAVAYAWQMSPDSGKSSAVSIIPRSSFQHELIRGEITNNDLMQILSSDGSRPFGRLLTAYMKGSDLLKLCEIDYTLGREYPAFRFSFGNLRYHYVPERMRYNRISDISVQETQRYWASFSSDNLYPVVMTESVMHILEEASELSGGILDIPLYAKDGTEIAGDPQSIVLKDRSGAEVTTLSAMQNYIGTFSRNVLSLHDISSMYSETDHVRIEDSLTVKTFLSNTTPYAWKKYGQAAAIVIGVIVAWKVIRLFWKLLFPRHFRENY